VVRGVHRVAAGVTIMSVGRLIVPPLEARPLCSIVIPCLNEARDIEAVVRGAMEQRYPPQQLEILVADGGSTDATREIVARLAEEDPRVQLVDNPGRFPSAGMNAGIRRARGAVIVRMDAHAAYAADYVLASVEALQQTGASNVGGAARARHRSTFQRAVSAALSSPLAVGGSAYRDATREGFVETVFNGAFRREVIDHVGLYDERARANEDAELNQRIIEAGGRVYLSRAIVAFYYPRTSLRGLAVQYLGYGQGRARTLLRRRRLLSARPLVPFAAVTIFAVLAVFAALVPGTAWLLAVACELYVGVLLVEAARLAATDLRFFPLLLAIFPVMHAAHGLGVWEGLFRFAGVKLDHDRALDRDRDRDPAPR
jgi:cellulose synthase/poly-beta-1,6-N-acetylglucosamine synthase-like glycosyltransferase